MHGKKVKYIGGDVEIDLSLFFGPERNRQGDYLFLKEAEDYAWVGMGRDALKLALLTEGLCNGEEVLVPSFLCTKVLDLLDELQLRYKFFNVDEHFNPDGESLLKQVGEKTRAVILINYFGYSAPDFGLLESIKAKKGDVAVILDYAQSLFSLRRVLLTSPFVDYIATSLRKFLPLPDGAFLISNKKKIDKTHILAEPRAAVFERALGKIVKQAYLQAEEKNKPVEKLYLDLVYPSEDHFSREKGIHSISPFSYEMLKRIDFESVAAKRVTNARYLYEKMGGVFPPWDGETALLAVPILIGDRNRVRSALAKHNIYLPVHWPLDKRVCRKKCPAAYRLSDRILGLVMDQRYDTEDMHYLVNTLEEVLSEK